MRAYRCDKCKETYTGVHPYEAYGQDVELKTEVGGERIVRTEEGRTDKVELCNVCRLAFIKFLTEIPPKSVK